MFKVYISILSILLKQCVNRSSYIIESIFYAHTYIYNMYTYIYKYYIKIYTKHDLIKLAVQIFKSVVAGHIDSVDWFLRFEKKFKGSRYHCQLAVHFGLASCQRC